MSCFIYAHKLAFIAVWYIALAIIKIPSEYNHYNNKGLKYYSTRSQRLMAHLRYLSFPKMGVPSSFPLALRVSGLVGIKKGTPKEEGPSSGSPLHPEALAEALIGLKRSNDSPPWIIYPEAWIG